MSPANTPTHPRLQTRLSRQFGLQTPLVLAPMALASGGALAAACAKAGTLGLVGGGYGDLAWTQAQYTLALQAAETQRIGCGFITWKLDEDASALDWVLDHPGADKPRAIMLSFGDPQPYAARIAAAGATLICQVQRLEQVPQALEAGAQIIIAQGGEAGGHGMNSLNSRATISFVPELADWLAAHSPDTLLLAAGGIADGRTLAAALVLGADGALVGSRLWATQESLAAQGAKTRPCRPRATAPRAAPCSTFCGARTGPSRMTFGPFATTCTGNGRHASTRCVPRPTRRAPTTTRASRPATFHARMPRWARRWA
ncbi:nitronate monooxygenase [Polaromonas sp. P2-4]|nr:nitronate monooxygenase [Polaromonas sp. P2-4]